MELETVSAEGAAAELEGVTGTRTNLVPSGTMGVLPGGGPRGITEIASFKNTMFLKQKKNGFTSKMYT